MPSLYSLCQQHKLHTGFCSIYVYENLWKTEKEVGYRWKKHSYQVLWPERQQDLGVQEATLGGGRSSEPLTQWNQNLEGPQGCECGRSLSSTVGMMVSCA